MIEAETAKQAVEIAREFLETSGVSFHVVTKTISEGDKWIVEATTFGAKFILKIDKNTGKVIEYTPA